MLGRVNRPRPTPPDPASLNQIVEHSVLLRVSQLLEKLVTEQRNIAVDGTTAFNGKDKFLPGKIAIGMPECG